MNLVQDFVPPHALVEKPANYSILFNLLGISENDIGVDVDFDKREVTVFAKKVNAGMRKGFFWIFAVPRDACLSDLTARMKAGVLEISIPKRVYEAVAA